MSSILPVRNFEFLRFYRTRVVELLIVHVRQIVPDKFTKEQREHVWEFLQPYLSSKNEYEVRFGVVMLLDFYIENEYISKVLNLLDNTKHNGFYAKMAVAWAVSICCIKFPDLTLDYLKHNTLDDFTYNKALQKITESYRVDKETKALIRSMKRK